MDNNKKNFFIIFIIIIVSCCCCCCASVDSFFSLGKVVVTRNESTSLQVAPPASNPVVVTPPHNNKQNNHTKEEEEEDTSNNNSKKDNPMGHAVKHNDTNNSYSCEESLTICRDKDMIACLHSSKHGSKELFLVVLNGGESTLKVNVNLPNQLGNPVLVLEVPKHEMRRVHTESRNVGKSSELIVSSASAKCVLPLVRPVSIENFIQQVSFYSRQVTPIYVAYTLFVLMLLFGGTWACCKFRKKNRLDGNGFPYQEIEMGLPESTSAVNVDAADGWDHDWDDDDWDDEETLRVPEAGGHISKDGLTSRSSKTGGWENDWDD